MKESKAAPKRKSSGKPESEEEAKERKLIRTAMYIPSNIKQRLKEWSIDYGVPQSQLSIVGFWLLKKAIENNEIDIESMRSRSESPKFAYNLELDQFVDDFDDD